MPSLSNALFLAQVEHDPMHRLNFSQALTKFIYNPVSAGLTENLVK